jgi:hypothetical protein
MLLDTDWFKGSLRVALFHVRRQGDHVEYGRGLPPSSAYTTRGQHTAGESRRRKAVDKVGDALREVQQVLALFQAPASDLRATVEIIPQRGRGAR